MSPRLASLPAALLPLLVLLLSPADLTFSQISPAPAPEVRSAASISIPPSSSPSTALSPELAPRNSLSPPAPPTDDISPTSSPSPSPSVTPSPVPAPANELIRANDDKSGESQDATSSEGRGGSLSGGQVVGIVIGVLVGTAIVGMGAMVYKKRQANLRRARYLEMI